MNINSLYGGNYLKAADLEGRSRTVTIASEEVREFDDGSKKLVLSFRNTDKTLVLNSTNAKMLAAFYGTDSAAWIGKVCELRPEKVSFAGNIVDAIRVYVPQGQQPPAAPATPTGQFQQPAPAAKAGEPMNDDIPW